MSVEVKDVLDEIKRQTEKFGGLREMIGHSFSFGDPSNSVNFDYMDIINFINRYDLSPGKLAKEFIQEKIFDKYIYLGGLDEQRIKPRVFKGSLDERYEIGRNIFGGEYKIKYFIMGKFLNTLVDKVILDFIGATKEEFLSKAKEAKIEPAEITMRQKDNALMLIKNGPYILDNILEPRFFDRIGRELGAESFICLLNGGQRGVAFKWSEIEDIMSDGAGSDSSKIRAAARDTFGLTCIYSNVFYFDSTKKKCFSVSNDMGSSLNIVPESITRIGFNNLIENIREVGRVYGCSNWQFDL